MVNNSAEQNVITHDFFMIIKRHYKIILSVTLFFILFSLSLSLFKQKVYKSTFTIDSYLTKMIFNDKGEKYSLIDVSDIEKIIKVFDLIYNNRHNYTLTFSDKRKWYFHELKKITVSRLKEESSTLEIEIYTFDNSMINAIADSLITFINNNPYIKRLVESEKQRLTTEQKIYEKNIAEMYVLKRTLYTENNGNMNFINFNIYNDIVNLTQKKSNVELILNKCKGVEYMTKPVIPLEPYGFSTFQNIIIFLIMGILIGIFIAYLYEKLRFAK